MHLSHQTHSHSGISFEHALNILIKVSRQQRYTYQELHLFFQNLAELVDLGSYSLSLNEFIFYLRRLCRASVPIEKAMDWLEGSFIDIDLHLSKMDTNNIKVIADYLFSQPFTKLINTLIYYEITSPDKKVRERAGVLIDLSHNFAYLVKHQLQLHHLPKPLYQLPQRPSKKQVSNQEVMNYKIDPNLKKTVCSLLNDETFYHLSENEVMSRVVSQT